MRILFAILCVVLLFPCLGGASEVTNQPTGTRLSGDDLKGIFATAGAMPGDGLVMDGMIQFDWTQDLISIIVLPDGRAFLQSLDQQAGTTSVTQTPGNWRIVGDTICWNWKTILGAERCRSVYKVKKSVYQFWTIGSWPIIDGSFTLRRPSPP